MDLRNAINCLEVQKQRGYKSRLKIGLVTQDFPVPRCIYKQGDIVLFEPYMSPTDCGMQMGEYWGREQKPTGKVVVEKPLSPEEIAQRHAEGSRIITLRTMVHVPQRYVEEVLI